MSGISSAGSCSNANPQSAQVWLCLHSKSFWSNMGLDALTKSSPKVTKSPNLREEGGEESFLSGSGGTEHSGRAECWVCSTGV